jgi:hypothetical protein
LKGRAAGEISISEHISSILKRKTTMTQLMFYGNGHQLESGRMLEINQILVQLPHLRILGLKSQTLPMLWILSFLFIFDYTISDNAIIGYEGFKIIVPVFSTLKTTQRT